MTKLEEKNASGGETAMLHLDDWNIVTNYLMIQLKKSYLGLWQVLIIKLKSHFH